MLFRYIDPGRYVWEEKKKKKRNRRLKMGLQVVIDEIKELDYDQAMQFCGDDDEFYEEILVDYATNGRLEKLQTVFEAKDWENYRIEVHSLKGTSRMVGLAELGDKCELLQHAAEEKNEAVIMEKHDEMMKDFSKYVEIIKRELVE